jgi:Ferritin-like domain
MAADDWRSSRANLLKIGAVGVGVTVFGGLAGARPTSAMAAPSAKQDMAILNYALLLEYLQADFYKGALAHAPLRGELREFAEVVGDHERQHVDFLKKTLGKNADPKPTFSFRDAIRQSDKFAHTATVLEDAGVLAYNGEASNLTRNSLAAAASIVSVEGRHAAWIRDITGVAPAPSAADVGKSAKVVVAQLRSMKLVSGHG